jgi:hypothetical protein
MDFVTEYSLKWKTDGELGAMWLVFNDAVAAEKPFTREWTEGVISIDNIVAEQKRRSKKRRCADGRRRRVRRPEQRIIRGPRLARAASSCARSKRSAGLSC